MADTVHDAERLKELQALPLERKIQITQTRIIEWYQHYNGNVCVSFSGGKDSTVLLHIARQIYPNIPAVFSNTGLEYSAIQRFVKSWDNVDIVVPKMRFDEVISTFGYPLIGKEVAEAIYYARRLRSRNGNVERERERERAGRRKTAAENSWADGQPYLDERIEKSQNDTARLLSPPSQTENGTARSNMREADRRRDNLCGKLHWRDWGGIANNASRVATLGTPRETTFLCNESRRTAYQGGRKPSGSGRNSAGDIREQETEPG